MLHLADCEHAATIRYEMDQHHTFEYVEGCEICPIAPGTTPLHVMYSRGTTLTLTEIKAFYPSNDTYFQYCGRSAASVSRALSQLHTFIIEEGPFDGVIGFSQGAGLIATYLIQINQQQPETPLPFRCAIFFSSAAPIDARTLHTDKVEMIESGSTFPLLTLPTAHIWGSRDVQSKDQAEMLYSLCDTSQRDCFVHGEGHEIPGARAKEDVESCVRIIRRTIERASIEQ